MHKKTAPLFVHYGEPEKIKKSFAFNVDIFNACLAVFVAIFAYKFALKGKYGGALALFIGFLVLMAIWTVVQLTVLV